MWRNFIFVLVLCFVCIKCNEEFLGAGIRELEWRTSQEAFTEVFSVIDKAPILEKSRINNAKRLLFVAGLQGSGQELWQTIFERCELLELCRSATQLNQFMMRYDKATSKLHGLIGAADTNHNAGFLAHLYVVMKRMTIEEDNVALYILGFSPAGIMSYPTFDGALKPLDYPDLHTLSAIAEAAGMDFRVLVLQANAVDILNKANEHSIANTMEPKVLNLNADALYSQLRLIDRRFYHCIDYRTIMDVRREKIVKRRNLLNFIHPEIGRIWDELISENPIVVAGRNETSSEDISNKPISPDRSTIWNPPFTQKSNQETYSAKYTTERRVEHFLTGNAQSRGRPVKSKPRSVLDETIAQPLHLLNQDYHVIQLQARMNMIDQLCDV